MKNFKKFLALFITITVAFAAFGSVFVYADENDVPVNIGFEIANKSVNCGDSFPINVRFDFDSAIEASGGIIVFRYILKYDADVLDIVDPNTMQPLEIGEDGYPTEGSFFIFGNIGEESSLTVLKAGEGQLRLVYGGRSALSDIMTSGPIAQFAFKVKSDLQLNESLYTSFEIVNPEISLTDKNYKAVIETEKLDVKIMSQFTIPSFGSQKQNTTLNISGRSSIGTDGTEPLMAKIVQGENVIEEKQADVTATRFNVSFELAEENYPVGDYKLVMTYGSQSASRSFGIIAKDSPIIIPDPVEPTEPDDGNKDDDKKDDNGNTGGNSSGNGGTGGSGIGLGDKTNARPNTSTDTKPDTDTNKDNQNNNTPDNKPSYPTDIDGHWAKSNIEYVYDHSLMNGYPEGIFAPENSITRAEFATVMSKFMELGEDSAAADKFSDVDGHWAKGYIGALYSREIVNGVSDIEFAPDANITRQEIATILARAFKLTEKSADVFADNDSIAEWASDFVYITKAAGYMQGDENNNFNPIANATRAEVATIIYRLHTSK
jgi:hypothetical protein